MKNNLKNIGPVRIVLYLVGLFLTCYGCVCIISCPLNPNDCNEIFIQGSNSLVVGYIITCLSNQPGRFYSILVIILALLYKIKLRNYYTITCNRLHKKCGTYSNTYQVAKYMYDKLFNTIKIVDF